MIVNVLMIISLMLSIGIEFLKKVLHYNEAVGKIVKLVSINSIAFNLSKKFALELIILVNPFRRYTRPLSVMNSM